MSPNEFGSVNYPGVYSQHFFIAVILEHTDSCTVNQMFNDVVVTLVQLIESSESSASVSIFMIVIEAPAHQCPSETSCSFCLLGKVACNIQNFAQVIYYGKISHLEN